VIERSLDHKVIEEALTIWVQGGWAMIALAANAIILFSLGFHVWLRLRSRGRGVPESTWRRWLDHPAERRGPVGQLIDFVMEASHLKDMAVRFAELASTELGPFDRDIRFMRRAVSTAPLLGLLGTVTGMLSTFGALAAGSSGQKTMNLVAGGISEALITTETGLVIALPGLFFQFHLARHKDRYAAFLAHLETVCAQKLYRSMADRASSAAA
jgi:biopolymer transport protein ExbB